MHRQEHARCTLAFHTCSTSFILPLHQAHKHRSVRESSMNPMFKESSRRKRCSCLAKPPSRQTHRALQFRFPSPLEPQLTSSPGNRHQATSMLPVAPSATAAPAPRAIKRKRAQVSHLQDDDFDQLDIEPPEHMQNTESSHDEAYGRKVTCPPQTKQSASSSTL